MRVVAGGPYPWEDGPSLFVDHTKRARTQLPLALDLYVANAFSRVQRAATASERWAAAQELLRCPGFIPWNFANPRVRLRLAEEAARQGWHSTRRWLRTLVFPSAVLFVSEKFAQPQRIRLGKRWVADADGHIVSFQPCELPVVWAARWLRQAIRRRADAIVLDREESTADPTPAQRAEIALFTKMPDRPENIIARSAPTAALPPAETPKPVQALFRHLARLSPRERELLRLQEVGRSTAEIAATFGCSVEAVRQTRHRLRKKHFA